MKKLLAALAVTALTATAAFTTAPAHANIGPDTWTRAYTWDGPGTSQTNQAESSVQTLDCRTIVARETRTDRATRYHRVENAWPAPNQAAQYPHQQRIVTVLTPTQGGWNVVHSWTPGHPALDLSRVVWVPPCADDLNPLTAPPF